MYKEDNSWFTTSDHMVKFRSSFKEFEEVLIPAGTLYKPTKWVTTESTVVNEPIIVDFLSLRVMIYLGNGQASII